MTAGVSPSGAAELAASATAAHPYSMHLWQQRQQLLVAGWGGTQHLPRLVQEVATRGLKLPQQVFGSRA